MIKIFSGVFRWLARQAATLLLILAVLIVVAWFAERAEKLKADLARDVATRDLLSKEIEALKSDLAHRTRKLDADIRNHGSILERDREDHRKLSEEHYLARWILLSEAWQRIKILESRINFSQDAIDAANQLKGLTQKEINAFIKQRELEMADVDRRIADIEEKLKQEFGQQAINAINRYLLIALGILAGIILIPIAIRIFLYFVVAPWAAGRPPVRLLPAASGRILSPSAETGARSGLGKMSAVSLPIVLGENQELLIQPEYFQSTSVQSRKSTKWLLNASIPVSSLLSGMFMLTRVEPAGSEPIVISATRDPLSEVGIVDLADGAAFVCQPRSLAGVIQDRRKPIRITRHWRLGSLQSWLTLQLRFLVFHGPGQLIVKGCRGIRIESAKAGRLINQAATLGFSADLDYSNVRCETFVSYWTGKEELFNDLFKGESGVYVYEETPNLRRAGIGGRPLEGWADAVLEIFGV